MATTALEVTGHGSKQPPTPEVKERLWDLLQDSDFQLGPVCTSLGISKSTFWNWVRADADIAAIRDRAMELREHLTLDNHREVMDSIAATGRNLEGEKASQQQLLALMFSMKHDAARTGDREYRDSAPVTVNNYTVTQAELMAVQEAYWQHQQKQG